MHFDGARMPYCMHFNGGCAMHEGYVPPYAASHGCIRLPKGMAEHFFDASPEGTPVVVKTGAAARSYSAMIRVYDERATRSRRTSTQAISKSGEFIFVDVSPAIHHSHKAWREANRSFLQANCPFS